MKRLAILFVCLFLFGSTANAWNDKGHMAITRLAWKELSADERTKILKLLESHPHYKEFLCEAKPENIPLEEWIFMRAATWSDWVRGGPPERKAFNRPEWHYINIPIIPQGDDVKAPGEGDANVVKQVGLSKQIAVAGGDRVERAVHLTWLFHLITDMHQPLHCCTLYSKQYPEGDKGGNLSKVQLAEGGLIQLHGFWDGLLGKEVSNSSLGKSVLELEESYKANSAKIDDEIAKHTKPMEWAMESHDQAVKSVYLDLNLKVTMAKTAFINGEVKILNDKEKAPVAPAGYAQQAGECARYQGAKAAKRLAAVLKEVAAAN